MTTTTTSCATRKSGGTPHVVAALIAGIIATGGVGPWLIQEGYPADAVGGAFLIGMLATLVVGSTLMAPEDKALKRHRRCTVSSHMPTSTATAKSCCYPVSDPPSIDPTGHAPTTRGPCARTRASRDFTTACG
jgi:hypothetical protein